MKKLFIIDLMNLAMRAYHGFSRDKNGLLSTKAGKFTFVCYGVALALNRLIEDHKPDYVVIASDMKGQTFRHQMYSAYKSNRKPQDESFLSQLDDLYRMVNAYGFKTVKFPATEADDVIGTLCERFSKDMEIVIVSGDKDFMQLVGDNVTILKPENMGTYRHIGREGVFEKFGCAPEQVIDALAIIGDASDVVPGVMGIGEVGAKALLKSFGTLENVYANLGVIKPALATKLINSKENAFLSKQLVTIVKDIPINLDLAESAVAEDMLRQPELMKFFAEMEFNSFLMQSSELVGDSGANWMQASREETL